MEEEVRKIVRDELSKYFCNIDNNNEYDSEIINNLEHQLEEKEVELYKRTEECKNDWCKKIIFLLFEYLIL